MLLYITIGYYLILNVLGFFTMVIDKKRAKKKEWRISEKTLLMIAFLGGAAGSILGMQMMRHKTKHMKFVVLVPLCFALHIVLAYLCYRFYF